MTKVSDTFRTPPKLFQELDEVFNFFWDACCTKDNCLVKHQKYQMNHSIYGSNPHDYLTLDLCRIQEDYDEIFFNCYSDYRANRYDTIFINPPYSRGKVGPIIKKAWEDARYFRVVMLLKADMSTKWFSSLMDNCWPRRAVMQYQERAGLKAAYEDLLKEMTVLQGASPASVGILHLRKRVKFLADEEMFMADKGCVLKMSDTCLVWPNEYVTARRFTDLGRDVIETKNFKRGPDGLIYPKSTGTFPSMIVVLDRRT